MKWWLLIVMIVFITACSSSGDVVLKPKALEKFNASAPVSKLWSKDTGKGNDGKYIQLVPLVDNQRLVTTDIQGDVAAWSLDSGEQVWQRSVDVEVSAGVGGGSGLAIIGSTEGELIALSAATGEERWRKALKNQVLSLSDSANGMIVARLGGGKVVGVSLEDGSVVWEHNRDQPSLSLQGQGKPLTAHGGVAIGMDDGSVVMLQMRSGGPIWEAPVASGRGRTELERLVDVDGSLELAGDELFAVAYQGNISAIDARSGRIIWSKEASSSTGVVVDSKAIYFTDDSSVVHAVSRNTGIEIWSQKGLENRRVTRPTLMGSSVVVADYDGYLHWLDNRTGQFVQRQRAASTGILNPPVGLGSNIAVLADNGVLSIWSKASGL